MPHRRVEYNYSMDLPQTKLIELVKAKCLADDRIVASLTYGSFTKNEGDQYSDIEFWLFFDDEKFGSVDQVAGMSDIAPIFYSITNEYGTRVAFYKDHLIRGELHFALAGNMYQVEGWPAVESERANHMVVSDNTGNLHGYLIQGPPMVSESPADVEQLCGQFLNWLLFGMNVHRHSDLAQAHMILGIVQG